MRRLLNVFWIVGLLSLIAAIGSAYVHPYQRCSILRNSIFLALDQASSVQVIEHSHPWDDSERVNAADYKETVYATVTLNAE